MINYRLLKNNDDETYEASGPYVVGHTSLELHQYGEVHQ